jgi:peptidyl-tRNA hydrolase
MFASLRAWQLTGTLLALVLACGGGKKEPSVAEALAESDKKAQDEKAAKAAEDAKLTEAAKKAKEGVLEHPWTFDAVRASLTPGMLLTYEMSGKNAKGKPVSDRMLGEVKGGSDSDVKILQYKESQKGDPAVTQTQGHKWENLSPFFRVEQSETKVLRKESVQVPAGTFDCVVADITGFFGNHLTVWMIVDKPGIYAQVVEHANVGADAKDKTEIAYKLASIEQKG